MYAITYVSSAVTLFSSAELSDLLNISRLNNIALGVTGMMLYKDGNVMQVLEGDMAVVKALYAKIGRDPRHRGLLTLLEGPVPDRQFPSWSMGFKDLGGLDEPRPPGYTEFLNTPLTAEAFSSEPTRSQKLLSTFKKAM